MNRRLLSRVGGALAVLALVLFTSTGIAAATTSARGGSAPTTFTDPTGDSKGAPDITSVVIADVPATGTLTITVTASGLVPVSDVEVYIDADKNVSTGSASGSEYDVYVWQDANDWGWDLDKWTGTQWQEMPGSSLLNFSRSGDVFTWTLGKDDIGGATGFAFFVASSAFDASGNNVTAADFAPDGGKWTYDLTQPAVVVKPLISAPKTIPAVPKAGKRFTVGFAVTRSDTSAPLTSGTMICDPSVSGKVISHAEQFTGGVAALTFTIPKTAKGKILKVKVTIKLGTQSTTRIANFLVR